jgi:hypothetical protein
MSNKASRPLTIRETQAAKRVKVSASPELTITNISNQLIAIHQRPPKGVDFYLGAEDIRLRPNQSHKFRKNRLWMEQVERLSQQHRISVQEHATK